MIAIGSFVGLALEAADVLEAAGHSTTVIDPRWVRPISEEVLDLVGRFETVVVLEDGIAHAGIASTLSEIFRTRTIVRPIISFGLPLAFLAHSKRSEVLKECGLEPHAIAVEIMRQRSHISVVTA